MFEIPLYDLDDAPEGARDSLATVKELYGFIPNLARAMADSPEQLEGYLAAADAFARSGLTPVEREVVTLTVSRGNGCTYCMSAHSALAEMVGMGSADIEALRAGTPLPTRRLEALRSFTAALVAGGGRVPDGVLAAFVDAGFTRRNALEVVLGVAYKVMSNYVHHLLPVPLDAAFHGARWTGEGERSGRKVLVSGWTRPEGQDALGRYQSAAGPVMAKHGGRPILKARPSDSHVGSGPDLVVLMEFPSSASVRAAFEDPEYLPLVGLRDQAFARLEVTDLGDAA